MNRITGQVHRGPRLSEWAEITRGLVTSGVSEVDITWPQIGYKRIEIFFYNIILATDQADLWIRFSDDAGATFNSAANYSWVNQQSAFNAATTTIGAIAGDDDDTKSVIVENWDAGGNGSIEGKLTLYNFDDTTYFKSYTGEITHSFDDGANTGWALTSVGGQFAGTAAQDGIRFLASSGNINRMGYIVRGYR